MSSMDRGFILPATDSIDRDVHGQECTQSGWDLEPPLTTDAILRPMVTAHVRRILF